MKEGPGCEEPGGEDAEGAVEGPAGVVEQLKGQQGVMQLAW